MSFLLVLLICAMGGFAAGITSFGYAIICMLLLPMVIGIKAATLVTLVTSFTSYFVILYQSIFKEKVRIYPRLILIPIIGTVFGRFFGAMLFHLFTPEMLIVSFCVFMIALNIYFFVLADEFIIKPTIVSGILAGVLSGFFGSMNSIGGPPLVAYMNAVEKDKKIYTANLQFIFLVGGCITFFLQVMSGNITMGIIKFSAFGIIGVAVGTTIGFYFFNLLNREKLIKLIKYSILLLSVVLIGKTIKDYLLI